MVRVWYFEKKIKNFTLKLNYWKKVFFFLIYLFARDVLVMKNLEIKKTNPTLIISSKSWILGGLSFFDFQLFLLKNFSGK